MSETQPGHVPNGASPTPTATATATPDATTPAPALSSASAAVAAPAPTPNPAASQPAPATAPAPEPLAAPAATSAAPASLVSDTAAPVSFPPLPHISTDDFERTTDLTSTVPSAHGTQCASCSIGTGTSTYSRKRTGANILCAPNSSHERSDADIFFSAGISACPSASGGVYNCTRTFASTFVSTPNDIYASAFICPTTASSSDVRSFTVSVSYSGGTSSSVNVTIPVNTERSIIESSADARATSYGITASVYCASNAINGSCDEGHPVCRNCVKSKRECLGYDPGFRPQPAPSDIRPASSTPQPSLVVNPQENHTNNNPYPSAPPGYIPASAQPFAPSVQSDSSIQSFDQSNNNRQGPAEPSVEESDTMSIMASVQDTIDGSMSQPVGTPDLSTPALMPLPGQISQVGRQEKVKIQDLLALQGIAPPPPYPIVPIQQARLDQIQTVYLHTYAPAIDRFLETRWFRDKGLSQLLTNAQLMAQYSALIDAFNDPKLDDIAVRGRVESFEASVVWDTMSICRSARNLVRNGSTEPMQEYDLLTTANRFDILEALITDDHLKDNPLRADLARPPSTNLNPLEGQLRTRSLNFWNCIGHFLTLHDNEASSAVEIDETLARCRSLLDEIENRDVLYSMAIGRHLGQRLSDFHPRNRPENSSDERNANTKLIVAQRFIEDESKDKGTTQVVKRLCGMVHRLWELKNLLLPRA
ncbi:uncharacterized protein BHQ10_001700 [Talaromyces amestolkiae]|uniref:Zn(2)-C6 fungal-type domain-containing protein n=1 Tax=Talaromyces amestolkiae TaxID=1196081 RepID=A0A364KQ62_TALAM|nr:uncharacterized protein BHQ10_001700 [Talaromyces amestolkiae]RAO65688.1 hypothetical protein BHQ10_001700 [Talaromyces amestolkiae]